MARQISAGVGGVVKKVSKVPLGIGGVIKNAKKGVCGVGGVVKTFFSPFSVASYKSSGSTDTTVSSSSLVGSLGVLNLSLTTVSGGGTSDTYNGAAVGVNIWLPEDEDFDGLKVTFDVDITGYIEYRATASVEFFDSENTSKGFKDITSDASKSYTIPDGTARILITIWCRFDNSLSLVITNFKIADELIDLAV